MKNRSANRSLSLLVRCSILAVALCTPLPAAAQLCGQACAGSGVLQFNAPEHGQFGFARSRSMAAPPNLLQVDRPHFGSTSHNPDFTNAIRIRINSPQEGGQGEDYNIDFILPNNAVPAPGSHNATRYPFNPTTEAGFSFSGTGQGCNTSQSTFTIHEVSLGTGTQVLALALDFTHRCGTTQPFTVGQLRFNSSYPITGGPTTPPGTPLDSDGDGIPDSVETQLGTNPFVKDNDVFGNPRLFAMQLYRDFLAREGDPAGITFWSDQVASGAMTRERVVLEFLTSGEFNTTGAAIARLYLAYFLRPPDAAGLSFWIAYAAVGNSLASISEHFAGSAEFRSTYGPLGSADFLRLVYRNVLGRAPDPAGFDFWYHELNEQHLRWGDVMLAFSNSPEFRAISFAEVIVAFVYVRLLQRTPDFQGFGFWVGYLDSGNSLDALIQQVSASPEYRARFLP